MFDKNSKRSKIFIFLFHLALIRKYVEISELDITNQSTSILNKDSHQLFQLLNDIATEIFQILERAAVNIKQGKQNFSEDGGYYFLSFLSFLKNKNKIKFN